MKAPRRTKEQSDRRTKEPLIPLLLGIDKIIKPSLIGTLKNPELPNDSCNKNRSNRLVAISIRVVNKASYV